MESRKISPQQVSKLMAMIYPSPQDFYTQSGYVPFFILGSGMTGDVMVAAPRDGSNNLIAVKSFTKNTPDEGMENHRMFVKEVAILQSVKHKHVVGNITAIDCPNESVITMPYYRRGCLTSHLPYLTNQLVDQYTLQLTSAVLYLHSRHLAHRDIKPDNVLISDDGHVILTDFGLAWEVTSIRMSDVGTWGTEGYVAPELMDTKRKYFNLYKCDMYSLGVVLFNMLDRQPGRHDTDYLAAVLDVRSNQGKYRHVLGNLLHHDPQMRWDANTLAVNLAALPRC